MPVEAKPLFRPDVLRSHLQAFALPDVDRSKLQGWASDIAERRIDSRGEKAIFAHFLNDFFVELLGYAPPTGRDRYTLKVEHRLDVGGTIADAVLGQFNGEARVEAVVEGKGPNDPLDRPHAGRKVSAVDQAYGYAIDLRCHWIVVTSIKQIRLYCKSADKQTYERFDTVALAEDEERLKRFVFLLGAGRVAPESGRNHLFDLLAESEQAGRELTKNFYVSYANMRQDAFERLASDNPQVPRTEVLSATQKLLDRVLFVAFCEDRGLLPSNSLEKAYAHRDPYNPRPIWQNFQGLFGAIDRGNEALGIHGYNGGLFAADPSLDSLAVSDEVCGYFKQLGDYEYKPAYQATGETEIVDVDILGHIFEQSITDLERLRDEVDGSVAPVGVEAHRSRRKKEGAFYTPAFITRYIVEQALGGVLRERFERLRIEKEYAAKGAARKALADPNVYDLEALSKKGRDAKAKEALVEFWEAWQDELAKVRLLDPACGSGAFLIEAFDQLHAAYDASNERLKELRGHKSLFDPDRRILETNLYGVDLNEEAIEICRLSLWIKTAERGKTLASLDHSIRVGNSVVSDPAVHPRAFGWQAAFPEVFAAGGFDVVVGNPPYVRQELLSAFKPYWATTFEVSDGVADLFVYFFEQGLNVLRSGGRLAFITSGSWIRGKFGRALRKFVSERSRIESMIDFGEYQPFPDAEMIRPTIVVLTKDSELEESRVFKWLGTGPPPESLAEEVERAPRLRTSALGADAWELESDDVLALRQKLAGGGRSLRDFTGGQILYGVKTGLNEVFVIGQDVRDRLVREHESSREIIRTFVQGTNIREWYAEESFQYLIFSRRGIDIRRYPAVFEYLQSSRDRLEPKPSDWPNGKRWRGRKAGAYEWYELQDTVDYWEAFLGPKILWPDITNRPRFCMDATGLFSGDTTFVVPSTDSYLLGVLASWATWFFISKTAQPLRLRSDRWQYRLKGQYMAHVPIPDADPISKAAIVRLAEQCSEAAAARYALDRRVLHRMTEAFGRSAGGELLGSLNNKAQDWTDSTLSQIGSALKTSFRLPLSPFHDPRVAEAWESYFAEHRAAYAKSSRELSDAEAELNDRVFQLFGLTKDEVSLLMREVEH